MKIFALASVAFAALLTAGLHNPAAAQQWPVRSVKLIVPYPAGGNVDGAARIVADRLQTILGQPFIVENKAGAGGLIAGEAFAKSVPDGYTLFVGANGPVLFAPEIAKRDAYNWKRDFLPITSISMTPLVLEVHPSVPAKTLNEFFELARREPGKLTMASPGAGTTNHLLSELVQSTLGVQWVTAHYRGNAPAINDLIGGQVDLPLTRFRSGCRSSRTAWCARLPSPAATAPRGFRTCRLSPSSATRSSTARPSQGCSRRPARPPRS
jgi:tripartite-type tricarboxylate transporter receptor subunit TctC